MIKLSQDAFVEFERDGRVTTIRCHACGGLIELKALSPSAWQSSCPCGKYNTPWKGL
ncbi:MAG: hypothetical protein JWR69_3066 [Pedosphaera sp.]|nr:hypothetical protein [Pedosphaera sp.]